MSDFKISCDPIKKTVTVYYMGVPLIEAEYTVWGGVDPAYIRYIKWDQVPLKIYDTAEKALLEWGAELAAERREHAKDENELGTG